MGCEFHVSGYMPACWTGRFFEIMFLYIIHGNLFAEKQDAVFLDRVEMYLLVIALEQLLSFLYEDLFERFVSFLVYRNGDEELSVLIYPCISVSDVFVFYFHDIEIYCLSI